MLWPFDFLESLYCLFSSVLIYIGPHTYKRIKSYDRLNLPRPSAFNFEHLDLLCAWIVLIYHGPHTYTRVKIYGRFNLSRASVFNFERPDILRAWIGHPSEMLWLFEFLESLHCIFSSVSIYHGPHTYTRLKSYGRLNLPRALVLSLKCVDILCAWIGDLSKMIWPFEFIKIIF